MSASSENQQLRKDRRGTVRGFPITMREWKRQRRQRRLQRRAHFRALKRVALLTF